MMFSRIKQIFGVGKLPTRGVPNFLPKLLVPSGGIEGVAADGSCWEPWRVTADGEEWYRRISDRPDAPTIHGVGPQTTIQAYDHCDGDELTAEQQAELDAIDAEMVFDAAAFAAKIAEKKQIALRREMFPYSDDEEGDDE